MSKKITLLGSTGSIGTQSLDVIRAQGYEVFGLSAHSHVDKILEQVEEFHPKYVCMTNPEAAAKLDAALSGRANAPKLLVGPEGLKDNRMERYEFRTIRQEEMEQGVAIELACFPPNARGDSNPRPTA